MTNPSLVSLEDMIAVLNRVLTSQQESANRSLKIECPVPTYVGPEDEKTPQDFLEELERFQLASQCSENDLLRKVIPAALKGSAQRWFRFMGNFDSLVAFKRAFGNEFEAVDYKARLRLEMRRRTQAPEEPLTSYIHVMAEYFRRLGDATTEDEKVSTVMNQVHPSYRPFLRGKTFSSLSEMATEAKIIQADLLSWHTYMPPPDPSQALEPTLAFQTTSTVSKDASIIASAEHRGNSVFGGPPLSLAAIDPFTYHRLERSKRAQTPIVSRPRSGNKNSDVVRTENRRPNPQQQQLCWQCGSNKHYKRQCRQRVPGNWD